MIKELHVFYTCGGSDTEVKTHCKKHEIELSFHSAKVLYIFSDPKPDDRKDLEALSDLIKKTDRPVTVHLFKVSELGHGARAAKECSKLEALGATVSVAEVIPKKRGPKIKHKLVGKWVDEFRSDFYGSLSHQAVCDKILRVTTDEGDPIKITRRQLVTVYKK